MDNKNDAEDKEMVFTAKDQEIARKYLFNIAPHINESEEPLLVIFCIILSLIRKAKKELKDEDYKKFLSNIEYGVKHII